MADHSAIDHTGITGVGGGGVTASGARVYNSTNTALTSGSVVFLSFNSERWDDASYHSTVSNQTKLSVATKGTGRYLIGGHVQIDINSSQPSYAAIRKDGTTFVAVSSPGVATSEATYLTIMTVWDCTGGSEYFELGVKVGTTSINANAADAFGSEFWIERIGDT